MGIQVECPNGHAFKVKDKYAGKKGLCPHCEGQVIVQVPDTISSLEESQTIQSVASEGSVFDDDHPLEASPSASASLLGSSVIRHNVRCKCGESVPLWYAKCPSCGDFLDHS